ncbi:50S ribosomal protein L18 [Candidatus Adlerbacteria bacterium RIFCSPHIGHO2_01_FULL_54_23]|uniref:Large ribosomal subunit protein uL18 n=3 Tax=Candidatus Adleribacteriota TaxID=1752736 RepID=A0A1F4Y0E1_9BACT|nr:MAG: 50S ribosomal protein L18 [Candidatus Adlerbacteria bacterium GW2011_GWA1_54_10]KKW36175.1 MAG: 50S ribosomal protein L18 [Candidatus Adlerbacteria bacterium GW2011_GWA2_54_12]KKW37371.1 MAG: 50S ribosomal protein L18 [Candidatus Adlerbacteria bacterium GW2011_GWB1_54_7]OGC79005.1 MAG: 50S ribosomal protein L18 [Candidatus Adlerbacteria bacterium RIFCSPHIGHO2_01_FULL_54_23]OGC87445.1 MAG: 50S ribosomal protein L18 [Candidatus Adlerbacteria bacterium RIFCSPLOWO2_01_FULL_54_16]
MDKAISKTIGRQRRHGRIRARVFGTALRPRLCVYKSNRYLEAQIIDDDAGKTLASGKMADAAGLGKEIAARAMAAGIERVVFDRGGFRYAGSIQKLADAARESGLKF